MYNIAYTVYIYIYLYNTVYILHVSLFKLLDIVTYATCGVNRDLLRSRPQICNGNIINVTSNIRVIPAVHFTVMHS